MEDLTADDNSHVLCCDETLPYFDEEIENLWQNVSTSVTKVQVAVGGTVHNDEQVEVQDSEEIVIGTDTLLQCPMCLHTEHTQKACLQHISMYHLEYKFKCKSCPKDFSSFHSHYRHEREDTPKYVCGDCAKTFPFKSELDQHSGVHSAVLPYKCEDCNKRFAMKKSLKRHETLHNNDTFACDRCEKVCTSQERLYSHKRGAHGKGYDSRCAQNFQWPATKARHQGKCTVCQDILDKEEKEKQKHKCETVTKDENEPQDKKLKIEDKKHGQD